MKRAVFLAIVSAVALETASCADKAPTSPAECGDAGEQADTSSGLDAGGTGDADAEPEAATSVHDLAALLLNFAGTFSDRGPAGEQRRWIVSLKIYEDDHLHVGNVLLLLAWNQQGDQQWSNASAAATLTMDTYTPGHVALDVKTAGSNPGIIQCSNGIDLGTATLALDQVGNHWHGALTITYLKGCPNVSAQGDFEQDPVIPLAP
jgi:hypothetical protein